MVFVANYMPWDYASSYTLTFLHHREIGKSGSLINATNTFLRPFDLSGWDSNMFACFP